MHEKHGSNRAPHACTWRHTAACTAICVILISAPCCPGPDKNTPARPSLSYFRLRRSISGSSCSKRNKKWKEREGERETSMSRGCAFWHFVEPGCWPWMVSALRSACHNLALTIRLCRFMPFAICKVPQSLTVETKANPSCLAP